MIQEVLTNAPLVSIIIPIYNAQIYLEKTIKSAQNQTYKNIEIICVDDGSKDNSFNMVKKYQKTDSRIKGICTENRGVSSARNTGIDMAEGEYIVFLDSDDMLNKKAISRCIESMTKYPCDAVLFNHYVLTPEDHKYIGLQGTQIDLLKPKIKTKTCEVLSNFSTVWGCFYKKSIIKQYNIRFIEGRIYEDWEFISNFLSKTDNLYWLDKPLYYYRWGYENTISGIIDDRCLDMIKTFYDVERHYKDSGIWDNVQFCHYIKSLYHVNYFLNEKIVKNKSKIREQFINDFKEYINTINPTLIYAICSHFDLKTRIYLLDLYYIDQPCDNDTLKYVKVLKRKIDRKLRLKSNIKKLMHRVLPSYHVVCNIREMLNNSISQFNYENSSISYELSEQKNEINNIKSELQIIKNMIKTFDTTLNKQEIHFMKEAEDVEHDDL